MRLLRCLWLLGWLIGVGLLESPASGQQPAADTDEQTADWARLCDCGWFSRARAAADSAAGRAEIAASITAVDAANCRRSAVVAEADRWQIAWAGPAAVTSFAQTDRWIACGSGHGFDLLNLATGRPVWGGGAAGGGPLFPRLPPAVRQTATGPVTTGPVTLAAARLIGVVDLPVAGDGGRPMLAALDLAAAAEGRLIWTRRLPWQVAPTAVGLTATDSCCYVASSDPPSGVINLLALAIADGSLLWRRALQVTNATEAAFGPPRVARVQHLLVVATADGLLIGLDADNGDDCWQRQLPADREVLAQGWRLDTLAATADRLAVLRRPAGGAGLPEIGEIDPLDGRLLTRETVGVDAPPAGDLGSLGYGRPVVCGGCAVWPVVPEAGRQPPSLLIGRLPLAGGMPGAAARLVPVTKIQAAAVGSSGLRLGIGLGERLWCLEPEPGGPAAAVD